MTDQNGNGFLNKNYSIMTLAYPVCWRIIKRDIYNGRAGWSFERPKFLANLTNVKTPENFDSMDWENFFGTTRIKSSYGTVPYKWW